MDKRFQSDKIIQTRINKIHGSKIKFYGRLKNNIKRGKFECTVCGYRWKAYTDGVLHGHGCKLCSEKQRGLLRRIPDKTLTGNLKNIHGSKIKFLGRVNNTPVFRFECNICGHKWKSNRPYISSCQKCAFKSPNHRRSDEQVQRKINQKHGTDVTFLGRLKDNHLKGKFKCNLCSHEWETYLGSVLNGTGCGNCKLGRIKQFKLNGKTVNIQGYEPQALRWLRDNTNIHKSEVIVGDKSKIPVIDYCYEGEWRKYYPDFYIPSKKIIVEVKSNWTLLMNKWVFESIKAKRKAVKQEKYSFRLIVMDDIRKLEFSKPWYKMEYREALKIVDSLL